MPKLKMPNKPKIGASQRSWDIFEKKAKKYVDGKNEEKRRRELKDNLLGKIKI